MTTPEPRPGAADVLAVWAGEITGDEADAIMAPYLEPVVTSHFAPCPAGDISLPAWALRAEAGPEPEAGL